MCCAGTHDTDVYPFGGNAQCCAKSICKIKFQLIANGRGMMLMISTI